jgi:hypothetical protein
MWCAQQLRGAIGRTTGDRRPAGGWRLSTEIESQSCIFRLRPAGWEKPFLSSIAGT